MLRQLLLGSIMMPFGIQPLLNRPCVLLAFSLKTLQKEAVLGQQAWRTDLETLLGKAGNTRLRFSALVQGIAEQTDLDCIGRGL